MNVDEFLKRTTLLGPSNIIPFVGSGIMISLGYPSWTDLLLRIADFAKAHDESLSTLIRARTLKSDYFGAGDLVFEPEIPASDLFAFYGTLFDYNTALLPIHENLVRCPFPAYITTNFDKTLERALTKVGKVPESISDLTRFKRFNSRLSVYSGIGVGLIDFDADRSRSSRQNNGLVLKLHGDITSPEEIVLGNRQLQKLLSDESLSFLYRRILSYYTLIFIGYSGNDPVFRWHCENLIKICGVPSSTSFLLLPSTEAPSPWLKDANIIPVFFSPDDNYKQLSEIVEYLSDNCAKPDAIEVAPQKDIVSESRLHSLALLSFGLAEHAHSPIYECAVNSMVAEAAIATGRLDDAGKLADHISRTYHLPLGEAQTLVEHADPISTKSLISSFSQADSRMKDNLGTLANGLATRARAIGVKYSSQQLIQTIILEVLVRALSAYGSALSLSLLDVDPPESTVIDKVVRASINQLNLSGIGSFDKEVLAASFADLFIHPTNEEGIALAVLAQAALAHSLAETFSGGLRKIQDLMPSEVYLDANVTIPLIAKDHPRSSYYHELIVCLLRGGCDVFVLDVFLNEMQNHCRLAYEEMKLAEIQTGLQAKDYAHFHGPLWINAFISAFAAGGKDEETLATYLRRAFKSDAPKKANFKRVLSDLGVTIVDTSNLNAGPATKLSIHISSEKGKLTKYKAQVLADDEALQILYLHQRTAPNVWFITEDATLRRILRNLQQTSFSAYAPSRGVMPAQGAYLLVTSLAERPGLQGTFAQFLWNPLYVEMVDSMLASVIREMPEKIKVLKERGFAELREQLIALMQKEMERSEKNDIRRRAREYKLGKPEIVESILKLLGEK